MQLAGSAGWVEGASAVCGCELRTGNVAESDGEAERAGELDDSVQALVREGVFGNAGWPNLPVGQRLSSSIWPTFGRNSLDIHRCGLNAASGLDSSPTGGSGRLALSNTL